MNPVSWDLDFAFIGRQLWTPATTLMIAQIK